MIRKKSKKYLIFISLSALLTLSILAVVASLIISNGGDSGILGTPDNPGDLIVTYNSGQKITTNIVDVTVNTGPVAKLVVTGIAPSISAGATSSVTVGALDAGDNVVTGYTGVIHFTSSDPTATLAADYTFTASDNGTHTFTEGVVLITAGLQTVTATDIAVPTLTGTQANISVIHAPVDHLLVSAIPDPFTSGASANVTIAAKDVFENTVTDYAGKISFASTDPNALLPPDYTFTPTDSGIQTFADGVTLFSVGEQSVTVVDLDDNSVSGTQSGITVIPGGASYFVLAGISSPATVGQTNNITVTAYDAGDNIAVGYNGSIGFTSIDPKAILPPDYKFTAEDKGVHTFPGGVTMMTVGIQALEVKDLAQETLKGGQSEITVVHGPHHHLMVSAIADPLVAGATSDLTVTAQDLGDNVAVDYGGTVAFVSSDPKAILPQQYTFTPQDGGVHTFAGGVKFRTQGEKTVVAIDVNTATITGLQKDITVLPHGPFDHLEVIQPANGVAGENIRVSVKATDIYGNTVTDEEDGSFKVSLTVHTDLADLATSEGTILSGSAVDLKNGVGEADLAYTKAERIFIKAVKSDGNLGSNVISGTLSSTTEVGSTIAPTNGSGRLSLAYVNSSPAATADETWTVSFVSDSVYGIAGSLSGAQGSGEIDDTFSTDNGFITLPETAWSGDFKKDDVFTFVGVRGTIVDPNLPATMALTLNPQSIIANGTSSAALTTLVRDAYDNKVLPTVVDFSIIPTNLGIIDPKQALTSEGSTSTLVTSVSGEQGFATLTASTVGINGATVSSTIPIILFVDPEQDMMVKIEGGPAIFVPAGALPPNTMVDARRPSEVNDPDRLPVEDMREKIDDANLRAEEGTPADIVLLDMEDNVWQFNAWVDGQIYTGDFNDKGVQLHIPYLDDDEDGIVDGTETHAKWLRVFWLNDEKDPVEWELVKSELHDEVKEVWAWVPHFSIYALNETEPEKKVPKNLEYVSVYPNPFVLDGSSELTFINLPQPSDIEFIHIYNVAGELVHEINQGDLSKDFQIIGPRGSGNEYRGYHATWNGKTRNGRKMASGIYIYVIQAKGEDKPKIGKIGVVK